MAHLIEGSEQGPSPQPLGTVHHVQQTPQPEAGLQGPQQQAPQGQAPIVPTPTQLKKKIIIKNKKIEI